MANNPEDVRCFLRDVKCPSDHLSTYKVDTYRCRAWDGSQCLLLALVKDFLISKMTIHHPASAAPPEVKS